MDIASIKDTALALEMLRAAEVSEDKVKLTINHSTSSNSLREEDVERVLEVLPGIVARLRAMSPLFKTPK